MARQLVLFGSISLLVVALGHFCFHYLLFSEQLIRFFLF
jgi:hypothetical protein